MFEIGKDAICIDDSVKEGTMGCPLKKHRIYTVKDIKENAGAVLLDVGFKMTNGDVWWFFSYRFRPLSEIDDLLEKAMQDVDEKVEVEQKELQTI